MIKNKIIQGIWHPFFLVNYSVLALYTFNLGEVEWTVIFRPLAVDATCYHCWYLFFVVSF